MIPDQVGALILLSFAALWLITSEEKHGAAALLAFLWVTVAVAAAWYVLALIFGWADLPR